MTQEYAFGTVVIGMCTNRGYEFHAACALEKKYRIVQIYPSIFSWAILLALTIPSVRNLTSKRKERKGKDLFEGYFNLVAHILYNINL